MVGVVFQPFVLSLGASMATLGFFNSLGGFGGLVPTLVAPWGGWLADLRGRRLVLLGASIAAMGAFALYALSGWMQALAIILPASILLGIAQVSLPVNSALVGESVGARRRGSAYSIVMLAMMVPGIFVPVIAGTIADLYGFAIVFPLALAAEAVAFVLIARYLRDSHPRQAARVEESSAASFFRRAWLPPHSMRAFFWANAIDMFAWGMGFGLLYGLLTKEYGFTTTQLGILSAVSSLTWAVCSLPVGRLVDKVGSKAVLVLSEALGPFVLVIWITQSEFAAFAFSMVIFALTAALWVPARNNYVAQAVPAEQRGEIFGRLVAFSGLAAFPAAYIGGFLYDQFGFYAPILGNLLGGLAALAVLIFFVYDPKRGGTEWQSVKPTQSESKV